MPAARTAGAQGLARLLRDAHRHGCKPSGRPGSAAPNSKVGGPVAQPHIPPLDGKLAEGSGIPLGGMAGGPAAVIHQILPVPHGRHGDACFQSRPTPESGMPTTGPLRFNNPVREVIAKAVSLPTADQTCAAICPEIGQADTVTRAPARERLEVWPMESGVSGWLAFLETRGLPAIKTGNNCRHQPTPVGYGPWNLRGARCSCNTSQFNTEPGLEVDDRGGTFNCLHPIATVMA